MATFFGEILPVTSRAFEDEDDDTDESFPECDVCIRWSKEVHQKLKTEKLPCNTLIIAIGPAATGFAQTFILHTKYEKIGALFGGMKTGDVNSLEQNLSTDKTCFLYRNTKDPTMFVCQCNLEISAEQSHSFCQKMFEGFDLSAAYIAILCQVSATEYRSDLPLSDISVPFLRALKTSKFAGTPVSPYLEQPNFITGLPAQLLSYIQMLRQRAVLYACYTESLYLNVTTLKMFLPILNSTPIKECVEKNVSAEENLKKIVDQHTKYNSLYL